MTRLLSISAVLLASIAAVSRAAEPPTTQPAKPIVLVLPFTTPSGSSATWVGRAAKDDIVAGLKSGLDATVRTPSVNQKVPDAAAALALAHQYHANFVVYGYAQEIDTIARVSGQVLDVESGLPVGGLKVTGPATSIIAIDDALTAQALAAMPQAILTPEAMAMLNRPLQPGESDAEMSSVDGLAMASQSYPVGSTTFLPSFADDAGRQSTQNFSYVYSPTIIVSAGYGYGGAYAPDYYGAPYGYPATIFARPYRQEHLPVIHHGPQRPGTPRGGQGVDSGVAIAGHAEGNDTAGVTFGYGPSPVQVSTPFMGGGQSFPVQNGFVTSGAAGFSPFTGPRFSNTPNLQRGGAVGRGGR